jgi:hypothetical protein
MNRCYAFSRCRFIWCPPRHLAVADLLTQLLRRYTPTVCRIIRCWRNEASDRPTVSSLRPSDHLVLLTSLLLLCNSSGASRNWTVGSSDSDIFICSSRNVPSTPTLCTNGTVGSSDGVNFLPFLPRFWPLKNRLYYHFGMWYFCILGT